MVQTNKKTIKRLKDRIGSCGKNALDEGDEDDNEE
jgi:hypothetical protein